ncbi:MAG: SRPBCC family protein [Methanobacteriota archaeon]
MRVVGVPGVMSEFASLGWEQQFDNLAETVRQTGQGKSSVRDTKNTLKLTLPTDREIVLTRVFDARRERVFKAFTDSNVIPEWWGPRGFTTTVDKMDVRAGGAWRYVARGPDGKENAFGGVYREIVAPERLVYTFEWEGMPGHVLIETITFEELPAGKTKVTATDLFHTAEERDGMLQSGMEAGARESMDRLDAQLKREK